MLVDEVEGCQPRLDVFSKTYHILAGENRKSADAFWRITRQHYAPNKATSYNAAQVIAVTKDGAVDE